MFKFLKNKIWYIILLTGSTIFVLSNWNLIDDFSTLTPVKLIFILWVFLLLYPLFSELEMLGIKIRKEVEKANAEISENVKELKEQIIELRISNNITNSVQIGGVLPTKEQLKELMEELQSDGDLIFEHAEPQCDEQSVQMFKIRYNLETTIKKIMNKYDLSSERITSLVRSIKVLVQNELIDTITADLITEIIKISNRSVHGEIISDEYESFVKKAYPRVEKTLAELLENRL